MLRMSCRSIVDDYIPADEVFSSQIAADLELVRKQGDESWLTDNPDTLGMPYTWARNFPKVKTPQMVVAGLLETGTLACLYGESNSGKSTFALEIALQVSHGAPWRGRRTRKGIVLWLSLEAASGTRRRVAAHCIKHGTDPDSLLFADVTAAVQFLELDDVRRLVDAVQIAETETAEKCVLVVVDTLARAMAGGDENGSQDMGRLVKGCDHVRRETGATVLLIHHSGKDPAKGARGSGSLRAAVDTEIEVSGQENPRQAKVTKQRDLPGGEVFAFDLEAVEIGDDDETGEAVMACAVVHRDDVPATRARPSGRNQLMLLAAIREHVRNTGSNVIASSDLRAIAKAQGLNDRRRFSEARESLERDDVLVPCVGGCTFQGDKL